MERVELLVTRAGDEALPAAERLAAFGRIVRRFQEMAYGCAYAILGDFHAAEDAAQEAFLAAYRDLPKLRQPRAFPGWFRTIVVNCCRTMVRRGQVKAATPGLTAPAASEAPAPADAMAAGEMAEKVLAAVRALPEQQRMATTLFYIDGYSQREIAEFLDVSPATVKKRLADSRARLKQRMLTMVDETLKSFPLPDRFAEVVVQMKFVAERINSLAGSLASLTDDQILARSNGLRDRLAGGEDREAARAEAFALVREAAGRELGRRHYDVQLVAAMLLDDGRIAQMPTGEGKTLTCLAAACMAALEGCRVHVVTPNDYLARRDAETARSVLSRLGLTVGHVTSEMAFAGRAAEKRRKAYECDVVYATAADLALDHLCDQTASGKGLQPAPPDVAIIDEADTVLLAQADLRLGLAGEAEMDLEPFRQADEIAREIAGREELRAVDPAGASVALTEAGAEAVEKIAADRCLDLDPRAPWRGRLAQALRAHLLVEKDVDYVVCDGKVILIDEATGRALGNQTWTDGLHQAVECRECVDMTPPPRIDAALTCGDYFRLYSRLAGLTGTAFGQRKAFLASCGLPVSVVPTRRPCHRVDHDDRIYPTADDRDRGLAEEVRHVSRHLGRPVLVAATNIAQSERLSELLSSRLGIDNEVLNALGHRSAREAEVVASAGRCRRAEAGDGRVGTVTVATLMAGRGTDIEVDEEAIFAHCRVPPAERLADLGVEGDQDYPPGSCKCCIHCPQHDPDTQCAHCFKPKVDPDFPHRGRTACRQEVPCGLHVVGAGRHAARACDDQLRLRAGRGGQPGSSRFFLCPADPVIAELGDELKDLAGPDAASRELIEGPEISEAVERAQRRAEGRRGRPPACMVLRRL